MEDYVASNPTESQQTHEVYAAFHDRLRTFKESRALNTAKQLSRGYYPLQMVKGKGKSKGKQKGKGKSLQNHHHSHLQVVLWFWQHFTRATLLGVNILVVLLTSVAFFADLWIMIFVVVQNWMIELCHHHPHLEQTTMLFDVLFSWFPMQRTLKRMTKT